jgi:GTP diphosphokinase / guanosine-3',5'-bis(diphosphate) 3'-diphosphatase
VHTHDCPAIHPFRFDPEKWVHVQWDPGLDSLFDVAIKITVTDKRGVLAKLAAEIATAESNIEHIQMADKQVGQTVYTELLLTLEVRNRMHLAGVLRQLRRLPEVVRIARVKAAVRAFAP